MFRRSISGAILVGALAAGIASAQGLGSVRLRQAVMADGQRLEAGTYQLRVTGETPEPGGGQSPGAERWVEFVTNGTVTGREVATVIPAEEIIEVAKGRPPARNALRVDMLKGGDYVRIWINRGTEHYVIHMPPAR